MKRSSIRVLAALCGMLMGFACAEVSIGDYRIMPKYHGVAPEAQPYVDEWLDLAKNHGLKFNNKVSIGFTDINKGSAIGMTHYGLGFREIDLDKQYWHNQLSDTGRMVLVWHEMSHAYCYRKHDYADSKEYGPGLDGKEGFFNDFCPTSIMFPSILPDYCTLLHFDRYSEEMFDRCQPY